MIISLLASKKKTFECPGNCRRRRLPLKLPSGIPNEILEPWNESLGWFIRLKRREKYLNVVITFFSKKAKVIYWRMYIWVFVTKKGTAQIKEKAAIHNIDCYFFSMDYS